MRVKIFASDEQTLEEQVNNFLAKIEREIEVIDIKFEANMVINSDGIYRSYSAMVIYKKAL